MEPKNPSQPIDQPITGPDPDLSGTSANLSTPSPEVSAPSDTSSQTNTTVQTSSTSTTVSVDSSSPVVNGVQSIGTSVPSPASGGKKKWFVPAVAGGALVALLAAGYVFGLYLPNKPEAVFSKSLSQSGMALDKLIDYTKEQEKNPAKSAVMDGKVNVKASEVSFDMTMEGKSSGNDADVTMDANFMGQKLTADLRMLKAEGSDNPDIFFKVNGAKDMLEGFGEDASQIAPYENKWIAVDHTLLDTYTSQAVGGASLTTSPTSDQINDALAKVQAVNREYIFTDNASKAVVEYKSFEGKSTIDGREVNQYKATYNKEHLTAYVKALSTALDESKLNDWFKEQSEGKSFSESMQLEELEKSIKDAKDNYIFDMYVDVKTKLVHSLVFTDPDNQKDTFTIYQKYTGGSSYPFGLKVNTDGSGQKSMFDISLSVDTKSDVVKVGLDGEMSGAKLTGSFTITPSNEEVKVEKPAGAIPVTTFMNQLGGGGDSVLGAFTGAPSQL